MALVKIENLSFSYYGYSNNIFDHVSFQFDTNWKTGLVGRNGIGKTTLFKLLLDEEEYRGSINKSVDCTKFPPDIDDDTKTGMEIFYLLGHDVEEWKLFKELNLLNVKEDILYRPFYTLSRGEQTKLLLAILFSNETDFLLIDEPTNHLDFWGRQSVSNYLKSKKGFLLISHDRAFLDNCIDHIISINKSTIDVQNGNFTSWYENKINQDKFETAENDRLKKDIKKLKTASRQSRVWSDKIENSKNGMKVSGVKADKGHIGHQSAKMMKKVKNLENRQKRAIQEKEQLLKNVEKSEALSLYQLSHHKEVLISVKNLSSFYGLKQILEQINCEIRQGERISVMGVNGSGKSTFIKILLGEEIQYTGDIQKVPNLKISYVPQDTSFLVGSLNSHIYSQGVNETICKSLLIKLGFSRDLFDVPTEYYSEGQKKKVLIAISLSQQAHLFIWDEPLNYIDIISRMQIEEIILKIKPTMIFVEHDKKFCDNIATTTITL